MLVVVAPEPTFDEGDITPNLPSKPNDVDKRSDSSYLRTKLKKPLNRYFSQHENPKINNIYPDIVDLPIFNDAS